MAHVVGRIAAGDHHGVKIAGLDVSRRCIRLRRIAVLRGIRLPGLRTDDLDVATRLTEPVNWIPEFQVLVKLLDEHGDSLPFELAHLMKAPYVEDLGSYPTATGLVVPAGRGACSAMASARPSAVVYLGS